VLGKESSDFEEFMALEKIKQQKDQLQSMMRLYGRPVRTLKGSEKKNDRR
jgi:hypothetical protein